MQMNNYSLTSPFSVKNKSFVASKKKRFYGISSWFPNLHDILRSSLREQKIWNQIFSAGPQIAPLTEMLKSGQSSPSVTRTRKQPEEPEVSAILKDVHSPPTIRNHTVGGRPLLEPVTSPHGRNTNPGFSRNVLGGFFTG